MAVEILMRQDPDDPFWDDSLVEVLNACVYKLQSALEKQPRKFENNLDWEELTWLVESLPKLADTLKQLGIRTL